MTVKRDEELMMLHDGELAEDGPLTAEERARLEALQEIGDVLRARMDLAMEEADPRLAGLWTTIERELEPAPERAKPAAARKKAGADAGGFWAWLQGSRYYLATGAVCAAAGALLALGLREPRVVEKIVVERVEVPAPAVEPPVVTAEARDAEVESLEVVGGSGTVFHIPKSDDDDAPSTVIWVTRDDPGPEGPI